MAADNLFDLKIITPDRVFYSGKASFLELNTVEGGIGIYKNHIPMTTVLEPGIATITEEGENKKESFDLGEFNLYMGGGFNETGDRIFLTQFIPENGQNNTELWELFRTSGKMERIATWYNANAEAAAQEP